MRLFLFSLLYLAVLIGIWVVQEHYTSAFLLASLFAFSPQFFWLIPLLLLMYAAFRKKNWAALDVQVLTLGLMAHFLMGLHFPARENCEGTPLKVLSLDTQQGQMSAFVLQQMVQVHDPDVLLLQGAQGPNYRTVAPKSWHALQAGGVLTLTPHPVVLQKALPNGRALLTRIRLQNRQVEVVNVHLPEVTDVFRFQASVNLHRAVMLQTLTLTGSAPTVLAGNFNASPLGEWARPLKAGYNEAMGLGLGYTHPAFFPVSRKDQVWYNNRVCFVQHQVLPDRGSSHRAVLTRLRIK